MQFDINFQLIGRCLSNEFIAVSHVNKMDEKDKNIRRGNNKRKSTDINDIFSSSQKNNFWVSYIHIYFFSIITFIKIQEIHGNDVETLNDDGIFTLNLDDIYVLNDTKTNL